MNVSVCITIAFSSNSDKFSFEESHGSSSDSEGMSRKLLTVEILDIMLVHVSVIFLSYLCI